MSGNCRPPIKLNSPRKTLHRECSSESSEIVIECARTIKKSFRVLLIGPDSENSNLIIFARTIPTSKRCRLPEGNCLARATTKEDCNWQRHKCRSLEDTVHQHLARRTSERRRRRRRCRQREADASRFDMPVICRRAPRLCVLRSRQKVTNNFFVHIVHRTQTDEYAHAQFTTLNAHLPSYNRATTSTLRSGKWPKRVHDCKSAEAHVKTFITLHFAVLKSRSFVSHVCV